MLLEHPFAPYIRFLGKGRNGARDLTRDEARAAMTMIFRHEAEPEQLGAFMMLMRVKEETAAELAGFTDALLTSLPESLAQDGERPRVAIDWPAYAGKRRHLPWFLLAALVLAQRDYPVFMHGLERDDERIYLDQALRALGISTAGALGDASERLRQERFAYLPAAKLSPLLQQLIEIRQLLGLRTPLHTVARMLNPFQAPLSLIGVFHPNYGPIHRNAAELMGRYDVLVCKGEGGEFERIPDRNAGLLGLSGGSAWDEQWPRLTQPGRVVPPETLDIGLLPAVWSGDAEDVYGEQAVVGTLALVIRGLGLEQHPDACLALATIWWRERDVSRIAAGPSMADSQQAIA